MTDLNDYAPLSDRVAALAWEDDLTFAADSFAAPLPDLQPLDMLVLRAPMRRFISYADTPNVPFEMMDVSHGHDWFAERETYRRVGVWLLHLLFSGRTYAGLTLGHPATLIRTLWVMLERPTMTHSDLLRAKEDITFESYDHFATQVVRHPFCDPPMGNPDRVRTEDRPMFRFGWSDHAARYKANPNDADQIILSLSPDGLCAMASLLMDFAAPQNDVVEVNIEPPFVGFGATQPLSLEARFWLPGSIGFYSDTLAEMSFTGMGP